MSYRNRDWRSQGKSPVEALEDYLRDTREESARIRAEAEEALIKLDKYEHYVKQWSEAHLRLLIPRSYPKDIIAKATLLKAEAEAWFIDPQFGHEDIDDRGIEDGEPYCGPGRYDERMLWRPWHDKD